MENAPTRASKSRGSAIPDRAAGDMEAYGVSQNSRYFLGF